MQKQQSVICMLTVFLAITWSPGPRTNVWWASLPVQLFSPPTELLTAGMNWTGIYNNTNNLYFHHNQYMKDILIENTGLEVICMVYNQVRSHIWRITVVCWHSMYSKSSSTTLISKLVTENFLFRWCPQLILSLHVLSHVLTKFSFSFYHIDETIPACSVMSSSCIMSI